jgi:hypothetical protein
VKINYREINAGGLPGAGQPVQMKAEGIAQHPIPKSRTEVFKVRSGWWDQFIHLVTDCHWGILISFKISIFLVI